MPFWGWDVGEPLEDEEVAGKRAFVFKGERGGFQGKVGFGFPAERKLGFFHQVNYKNKLLRFGISVC